LEELKIPLKAFEIYGPLVASNYMWKMGQILWLPEDACQIFREIVNEFTSGSCHLDSLIWTERRMTNVVLNVCFDFFSRHEKQI
jgi:hypothetical protein